MKITAQFDDNCHYCRVFIKKYSIAYRNRHYQLLCHQCYVEDEQRNKLLDSTEFTTLKNSETTKEKSKEIPKFKIQSPVNLDKPKNNNKPTLPKIQTKKINKNPGSKDTLKQSTTSKNIPINHSDPFNIIQKIKDQRFDFAETLKTSLSAYNFTNTQNLRDLIVQKSLESKIQILDHQILCAKKVKNEFNGRGILADEVGLGKTIEAGILLKEYFVTGMIKNALILTPPSLRLQWKDELKTKFDLDFVSNKDDENFQGLDKHNQLIVSLSTAIQPKNAEILNGIVWDIVIIDEAHRLKNSSTQSHKFVKNLNKKFILLLTATPVQNSIQELYNLVELVKTGFLGSWKDFSRQYTLDEKARKINPKMRSHLQDLLQTIVIRTTRNEVRKYLQFTDRIPKTHIINSNSFENQLYNIGTDIVRKLCLESSKNSIILPLIVLQRQICSSSHAAKISLEKKLKSNDKFLEKLSTIQSLCDSISEDSKLVELKKILKKSNNSKYLIFTEFRDTQKYIIDNLTNEGFSVGKFNGEMSTKERDEAVRSFKNDVNILVCTEAGGEGQNFQFCSNVINYDLPWNPMRVEQRVGRVHRIGQENDVYIHNLAINDSIEEYVLKSIFEKINLFNMTIGDLELLFEDDGLKSIEIDVFKSYMLSESSKDAKNKFSALGDKWKSEKSRLNETIMEFDEEVFANFNLSSMRNEK